jgi:hypothetical protein
VTSKSRRRRPARRSARRRSGWPWWVRILVGGVLVAAVVFAVLWFNALATWIKALSITGAVLLVAAWWLWTRRHDIADEMDRRAGDGRGDRR